ncbi:MAG: cbb3-type cytochrome c oxidase N-terminal domain-containing protein [Deltaproteobacteria bacterium]
MTEKDELIKDHEYDGIRELNNPLPGWWLATFYITIIFAVIYFVYYQFMGGPTLDEELASEMSVIREEQQEALGSAREKTEEDLVALVTNREVTEQGKAEFMAKCMPCHGDKGQGLIGPNLTDEYWIHGDGSISSILTVVNEGVPDKGMPPWKGVIPADVIESTAVYVHGLQGTDPPGAKAPQGEKIERK